MVTVNIEIHSRQCCITYVGQEQYKRPVDNSTVGRSFSSVAVPLLPMAYMFGPISFQQAPVCRHGRRQVESYRHVLFCFALISQAKKPTLETAVRYSYLEVSGQLLRYIHFVSLCGSGWRCL
jgi:hypothetical protein